MGGVPDKILTWQMVQPTTFNRETKETTAGKIEKTEIPVPDLKPGEALVEVAGCGVCHTDLGYFYDGVPTVSKPPLTLGHEISGVVVAGDEAWIGKEVIIPAVMPVRTCLMCKTGRGNRCLGQKMPGNSLGMYGGFSSHIPVPSIDLCEVRNRGEIPLSHLAVVADAATTPYQAAKRADLQPGDNVVVIGITGGVGQYMGQVAKALGISAREGWAPFVFFTDNIDYLDLEITTDELLKPNGKGTPLRRKPSLRMLRRLEKIESLPAHQQTTLLKTIDTFLKGAAPSR